MNIKGLRDSYHKSICSKIIRYKLKNNEIYYNFSDGSSRSSVEIGKEISRRIGCDQIEEDIPGQRKGASFESLTMNYIRDSFNLLQHLRPGHWLYNVQESISDFVQYAHLGDLDKAIKNDKTLSAIFGQDYIISPDIIISRELITDKEINSQQKIIDDDSVGKLSLVRKKNNPQNQKILHASISCKWTLRSDRSQNTRAEALNLIRNRKGRLPHILAVTAEPLPTRIASLALGTGDLDCVYHIALYEMIDAISRMNFEGQNDMLKTLVEGKRLRDISDLVFDLIL